jgi:hypothetical protein
VNNGIIAEKLHWSGARPAAVAEIREVPGFWRTAWDFLQPQSRFLGNAIWVPSPHHNATTIGLIVIAMAAVNTLEQGILGKELAIGGRLTSVVWDPFNA